MTEKESLEELQGMYTDKCGTLGTVTAALSTLVSLLEAKIEVPGYVIERAREILNDL